MQWGCEKVAVGCKGNSLAKGVMERRWQLVVAGSMCLGVWMSVTWIWT